MGRTKGEGRIVTSVTISPEFFQLAKKHQISFTEAMRIGLSTMFADRGEMQYDNSTNLFRKMRAYQLQAEEALQQLAELEAKTNGQPTLS